MSVKQHIDECLQCAMASHRPPTLAPLQYAELLEALEKVILDHFKMPAAIDPLTGQTVQYVLCMIDQATQWCELTPLPDCSAHTTALALYQHYICGFGWPKQIHSDLGAAYTSNLFGHLCALGHVDATKAENHKSESTHRFILSGLERTYPNVC